MNARLLAKYAEEAINIKILKAWQDDYSNLILVFDSAGKKHGAIRLSPGNDWKFCYGVGSSKITQDMPAGRGDYFLGDSLDSSLSEALNLAVKEQSPSMGRIQNKGQVSWSPKTKQQRENLAKLIQQCAEVNNYLSEAGILYAGDDKVIFGEDVSSDQILNWKIPSTFSEEKVPANKPVEPASQPVSASPSYTSPGGNTPQVESFIPYLQAAFSKRFGRNITIGSTFRDPVTQAKAMTNPLASGDYDRLYGRSLGENSQKVKELISAKRYEEAAAIIQASPMSGKSHMAGRAIDIPFSSNQLSRSDYSKFQRVVEEASQAAQIPARINTEKSSHFHIDVG